MGLLPRKDCFCSETQTYTDVTSEGHLRSREARLLQPDIVTAISAFATWGRIQNGENNPMHSSRQELGRWSGGRAGNGAGAKVLWQEFYLNI
ncbi:hypothetical protein GGD63_000396 [Bradyrhizobium sp. cir1]|uniref:hypothetical protein n=1 Tax=Bradyrhizobium sp. cir1 TaxID=1445730 RepID=UPI0016065FD4|nr:hypothetical protein [Bradyrhizobium sp. cir1]MBB4367627.1 hypothetical protein [Bradyrhizobium sp. cir1]